LIEVTSLAVEALNAMTGSAIMDDYFGIVTRLTNPMNQNPS